MSTKLKPCPFCGGAAVEFWYSGSACTGCKDCIAYLGGEESELSYEQLAEAWNARTADADLAAAQEEAARLRAALEEVYELAHDPAILTICREATQ